MRRYRRGPPGCRSAMRPLEAEGGAAALPRSRPVLAGPLHRRFRHAGHDRRGVRAAPSRPRARGAHPVHERARRCQRRWARSIPISRSCASPSTPPISPRRCASAPDGAITGFSASRDRRSASSPALRARPPPPSPPAVHAVGRRKAGRKQGLHRHRSARAAGQAGQGAPLVEDSALAPRRPTVKRRVSSPGPDQRGRSRSTPR